MTRYTIVPERSTVVVAARSSVGPVSFEAPGVTGWVDATVRDDGSVDLDSKPAAELEVDVAALRSGNAAYDAELARRIDSRRHPSARVRLDRAAAAGGANRFELLGDLAFHGVERTVYGTVEVEQPRARVLRVTGEQVIDIRDFGLTSPSILRMRIYPDVRVLLFVEGEG